MPTGVLQRRHHKLQTKGISLFGCKIYFLGDFWVCVLEKLNIGDIMTPSGCICLTGAHYFQNLILAYLA